MKPQRVCAQCGRTEPRLLWLRPSRMFKIWKGASSEVDLCSFECGHAYREVQRITRWAAAPSAPVERPQPDDLPEGVERLSDGGLVCRGSVIPTLGAGWEWGLPDGWRPCTDRPKFKRSAEVIYDVRPAPTDGEP